MPGVKFHACSACAKHAMPVGAPAAALWGARQREKSLKKPRRDADFFAKLLSCPAPPCIVLHCPALSCIVLHCPAPPCIVLGKQTKTKEKPHRAALAEPLAQDGAKDDSRVCGMIVHVFRPGRGAEAAQTYLKKPRSAYFAEFKLPKRRPALSCTVLHCLASCIVVHRPALSCIVVHLALSCTVLHYRALS